MVEHACSIGLRPNDFDWSGNRNNNIYPQLLEGRPVEVRYRQWN